MPVSVSINEAAQLLGVSVDTVKRRIASGQLRATREARPQGFRWLVELPDDLLPRAMDQTQPEDDAPGEDDMIVAVLRAEVARLEETVHLMATELDARRREVAELHLLLRDATTLRARLQAQETERAPANPVPPPEALPWAAEEDQQRRWWRPRLGGDSTMR